eukprot:scaffold46034_cov267-Amphora_coffeaeformis.AAC.1
MVRMMIVRLVACSLLAKLPRRGYPNEAKGMAPPHLEMDTEGHRETCSYEHLAETIRPVGDDVGLVAPSPQGPCRVVTA